MAAGRRKNVISSRRKRADEGEEEGSQAGDVEDDSLSEGSIASIGDDDADIEGSDISEDNVETVSPLETDKVTAPVNGHLQRQSAGDGRSESETVFAASKDTEAMMNGLKLSGDSIKIDEINFDDMTADAGNFANPRPGNTQREPVSKANVESEAPSKQTKNISENPTFVPTRGGFFLHDNRTAPSGPHGFRPYGRGRGRGFGPFPNHGMG
ncbi:MAG: hypothetical protein Q9227_003409 [Pyrenula ochraceoflavens]